MNLPLQPKVAPMEAEPADSLPTGAWQYEPKWDGLRCLVFRDDEQVVLQTKAGDEVQRYFPELQRSLLALPAGRFVLDGQLLIVREGRVSAQWLRDHIHPSAGRVDKLSHDEPAAFVAFDMLVDPEAGLLVERKLSERRAALEAFAEKYFAGRDTLWLSPATRSHKTALEWLGSGDSALDGVLAKKLDAPYGSSAEKSAARKVALARTATCVVGGLRWSAKEDGAPDAVMLGLYDAGNLLHYVGIAGVGELQAEILKRVRPLLGDGGFTGRVPGEPNRWGGDRSGKWEPVRPELNVQVRYGHFDGERFREPATIVKLPAEQPPRSCTLQQLRPANDGAMLLLLAQPPVASRAK
jgi:ATP-dependent DNA ligase